MSRSLLLVLVITACAPRPAVPAARDPLARLRAQLGPGWGPGLITSRGDIALGGLTGTVETVEDAATGAHRTAMALGPLRLAEGYDGASAWETNPDGAVAITEDAAARARAVTGAWLARRGYLRDGGATWAAPRDVRDGGATFAVITATPAGGSPIDLWIDRAGWLARTVERRDGRPITTSYGDWRPIAGGTRVPFAVTVDEGDPRNRVVVTVRSAARTAGPVDFAPPREVDRVTLTGATTIPFALTNNHIYVDAAVDGKAVRMVVDTGGMNVLTPAAAARLGLTVEGAMAGRGVGAEAVAYGLARAHALTVGDATLAEPVFFAMDLGALGDIEGVPLDGIIGYELFARLVVRIDYPGQRLTVARPGAITSPARATAVPFRLAERTPIVDGAIDGVPATFTIDTGSRTSLTVTAPFVKAHDLIARYHPRFETVTGWGVGGGVRSSPVRFDTVALGGALVRGVAGDLFTGDAGAFAGDEASGNIGSGLLRRFVVTFDYAARRMYLEPGPAVDAPDPYDRSGLFLRRDGDALRVIAVAPGSAAASAGIVADDRVIAIDGAAVATRPLPEWRRILTERPVGARLPLRVVHAGATRDATLVLTELLP